MSLKIIFFPVALIIVIVVSIWFIKPEFAVISKNKAVLDARNVALENIRQKQQNIGSLVNNLNNNKEKEDAVLSYISKERHEEDILNKIYHLANQSRVALLNFSLSESRKNNLSSKSSIQSQPTGIQEGEHYPVDFSEDQAQNIQLESIDVSIEILGEYEKIKGFLSNLYLMDRINSSSTLSISAVSSSDEEGEEASSSDNLSATIEVKFGYYPVSVVNKNSNLAVFADQQFNFSSVEKLIETINKIPDAEPGVTGKINPFTVR